MELLFSNPLASVIGSPDCTPGYYNNEGQPGRVDWFLGYPGAPHGFEVFAPLAAASRQLEADIDRALARALRSQLEPAPTR